MLATLKNVLLGKSALLSYEQNYFVLTSGKEEVVISFQSRFFGGKLPSELIFAQNVLINIYRLWLTVLYASINV